MSIATKYIESVGTTGDIEDILLAREALRRDLERCFDEARELMPIVDEMVIMFEEKLRSLDESKKVNEGLAKIAGMSGAAKGLGELENIVNGYRGQKSEFEGMIEALDNLGKDLTMKREIVSCPRCTSHEVSYRIAASEMGYSLYRCTKCGHAWRTRRFSMLVGQPAR